MDFERNMNPKATIDIGSIHLAEPLHELWMYGLIKYSDDRVRPDHQLYIRDPDYIVKILKAFGNNLGIEAISDLCTQYMRDYEMEVHGEIKQRQRREGNFRLFNPCFVKETKEENEYRGGWTILHFPGKFFNFRGEIFRMPINVKDYTKKTDDWFSV